MTRWVACAMVAFARAASAQEMPVVLDAEGDPAVASRITLELRALGHPVRSPGEGTVTSAQIRVREEGDHLRATIVAPGRDPVTLEIASHVPDRLEADALRVVESLRATLLRPVRAPPPPTMTITTRAWIEDLHGAVAAGVLVNPASSSVAPTLVVRVAWERLPWVEALGEIGISPGELGGGATVQSSQVLLGVGAPIVQGPRGALGLTLRGGVSLIEARGDLAASGVLGVVAGALTGRLQAWRRLGVVGLVSVGTTLAAVRVRAGDRDLGEWGRPYLIAAIGLSY